MNNEIKEILNFYKKEIKEFEEFFIKNYTEEQLKTTFQKNYQRYRNHKLLLDYITNLQEENENKTDYICDLITEKINYKSRIDKAIEYMNKYNVFVVPDANIKSLIIKEEYKKVINILKGGEEK